MNVFPTGTITFLFTDIEGSIKLWQAHPQPMQAALARHDDLLRNAIESEGGTIFKTIGDAFCAAFPTAPDALKAALAAQSALQNERWPEATPLRVRMALHTGVAEERDGDYFGPALNRVARLLSAGHGGQTLVSAASYELTRDHVPSEVTMRDLGFHRLKDLDRPEYIYQMTHRDVPAVFPPLRTLDNPDSPNNLPQQITSFIGLEKGVADARTLLAKTHLLTLTGSGGSGKTRLALQVAADVLEEYTDGAWVVELAPLADPALVAQTVAQVLGVKEQAGQAITPTLVDYLKTRQQLLILDNCEHVLGTCTQLVSALIRACPGVRVLATSREPLGIAGEQTLRMPSLSLPTAKQVSHATVESISQFEAVRLFIDRAHAVKPDFAVTNANAPALAQLCFRLDGIPLAIELAAARARSLSLEQINDKLDTCFRLLTGGDRSALPRQRTLRALVDWSYDLLIDEEKALVSRLSVFAGGWTLQAAEAVCGFEPVEEWDVLNLLTSLVDKSLVVAEEDTDASRYRMLETLRQYGSEKLVGSGETAIVQQRHLHYFVAFAEEAEPKLVGPEQTIWLHHLEAEHDNVRAALAWCAANANQEASQALGLRLAGSLFRFWEVRGYLGEGREQLEKMSLRPLSHTAAQAKVLNAAGVLAFYQGDYASCRAFCEQSLVLRRELGDKSGIATSLLNLGNVAYCQGDPVAARSLYEECLAIHRELGRRGGIADALMNLGNLATDQADYVSARSLFAESLTLRRELRDKGGIADALMNLGRLAAYQDDYVSAQSLYEESLGICRELGSKKGIAYALNNLGDGAYNQGDYDAARELLSESLVLLRELGDKHSIASSLQGLASLFVQASALHIAAVVWGAADALRERIQSPLPQSDQAEHNERIDRLRSALGNAAFSAAWDEGRALNMEQAIEVALKGKV